jgi:hypothetical protein
MDIHVTDTKYKILVFETPVPFLWDQQHIIVFTKPW